MCIRWASADWVGGLAAWCGVGSARGWTGGISDGWQLPYLLVQCSRFRWTHIPRLPTPFTVLLTQGEATPLYTASGHSEEVAKLLLGWGANIEPQWEVRHGQGR